MDEVLARAEVERDQGIDRWRSAPVAKIDVDHGHRHRALQERVNVIHREANSAEILLTPLLAHGFEKLDSRREEFLHLRFFPESRDRQAIALLSEWVFALVMVEEHPRRTVKLRNDYPLGTVDDEGAVVGH